MFNVPDFLIEIFPLLFLIFGFCALVHGRKRLKVGNEYLLWLTIGLDLLLAIMQYVETSIGMVYPASFARVILSYLCYIIRPGLIIPLIGVLTTKYGNKLWFWIPEIINTIVLTFCFFTKWVFYYDEEGFHRGPLGYVVFVVGAIYYVFFFIMVMVNIKNRSLQNKVLLVLIGIFNVVAVLLSSLYYGSNVEYSICLSCIFFYLFLNYQYSGVDSLTRLYNRDAFMFELNWEQHNISCISSIDLNGLKQINDENGHDAGDTALKNVGSILGSYESKKLKAFRIGGDEFAIIFRNTDEQTVKATLAKIKIDIEAIGRFASIGYGYKFVNESVNELWKTSDVKMYEDKAYYYSKLGIDKYKK